MIQRIRPVFLLCALLAAALSPKAARAQRDLLPDIIVRPSDLFDRDIVTTIVPGRRHLRLSNGTANVGEGRLYLYGVLPANADGTQDVNQRIYRSDGTFTVRPAGRFVYHPGHNHIHVEDWAVYRLRVVLPGGGVGEIVAEGEKTSFCILDLAVHDRTLPNFNPSGQFHTCNSTVQGLSVGWVDIYDKTLPGQNIDITDLPDGIYWLESEVDPQNHVLELNEDNNVTRIQIVIGNPQDVSPDAYEPNDTPAEVDSRPAGKPNSPNLGPCNPKRVIENLTVHERNNDDFFKFYSNATGAAADFVRIDFTSSQGNLDLALLDAGLNEVATSSGSTGTEQISLEGRPRGWYYIRVSGRNGALSPRYTLTVNPPANGPPAVRVLAPGAGNIERLHGMENFMVTWSASDPEDDPLWVSVFANTMPELDGNEKLLPLSIFTEADLGFFIINSAELEPGTYWVRCQVTDGGTTTGSWSEGTVSFVGIPVECRVDAHDLFAPDGGGGHEVQDCNGNGIDDQCDLEQGRSADCNQNGIPDECDIASGALTDANGDGHPDECRGVSFHRGDANDDGKIDVSDGVTVLAFLFTGGGPISCKEAANANADSRLDLADAITILSYLFTGGARPPFPGPPDEPCGVHPPEELTLGCDSYTSCK
jgi:hypothetical protein